MKVKINFTAKDVIPLNQPGEEGCFTFPLHFQRILLYQGIDS